MSRESDDLMDLAKGDLTKDDLTRTGAEEDLEDLALGEDYALNPEFVPMVADALDRGDAERLRELLGALHPADVADLMGFLSAEDRQELLPHLDPEALDRKSTRLNSSHVEISYAVFCLKKK